LTGETVAEDVADFLATLQRKASELYRSSRGRGAQWSASQQSAHVRQVRVGSP
jgi:hypothetical protein